MKSFKVINVSFGKKSVIVCRKYNIESVVLSVEIDFDIKEECISMIPFV